MSNDNVIEINNRDTITDALTDMLRTGAQQLPERKILTVLTQCQSKSQKYVLKIEPQSPSFCLGAALC